MTRIAVTTEPGREAAEDILQAAGGLRWWVHSLTVAARLGGAAGLLYEAAGELQEGGFGPQGAWHLNAESITRIAVTTEPGSEAAEDILQAAGGPRRWWVHSLTVAARLGGGRRVTERGRG
jgi:hypothetical protein